MAPAHPHDSRDCGDSFDDSVKACVAVSGAAAAVALRVIIQVQLSIHHAGCVAGCEGHSHSRGYV